MSKGKIKLIEGIYPISVVDAIKIGDGTNKTLKQELNEIKKQGGGSVNGAKIDDKSVQPSSSTVWSSSKVDAQIKKDRAGIYNPLYINTPCGSNEPYHPSVVYIPDGFNGYKFWMVQTPYPIMFEGEAYGREPYEDPCIHCSNDGIDWYIPSGLTNPIDDGTGYFSDGHLVYRKDIKQLECWYRQTTNGTTYIYRKTSQDGVVWSDRDLILDINTSSLDNMVRSQAVIWDNTDKVYKMWWVDKQRDVAYSYSQDGKTWAAKKVVTPSDKKNDIWHLDVCFGNGRYYLTTYGNGKLDIYSSANETNFSWISEALCVSSNEVEFWSKKLYRACMLKVGTDWRMYFSAETAERSSVGLMVGDHPITLRVVNGNYNMQKQAYHKGIEIVNTSQISSEIILTDKGTCIGVDYEDERVYIKKSDGSKFYLE